MGQQERERKVTCREHNTLWALSQNKRKTEQFQRRASWLQTGPSPAGGRRGAEGKGANLAPEMAPLPNCKHKNCEIFASISVKNDIGYLIGIALNLSVAFGSVIIFTILIL